MNEQNGNNINNSNVRPQSPNPFNTPLNDNQSVVSNNNLNNQPGLGNDTLNNQSVSTDINNQFGGSNLSSNLNNTDDFTIAQPTNQPDLTSQSFEAVSSFDQFNQSDLSSNLNNTDDFTIAQPTNQPDLTNQSFEPVTSFEQPNQTFEPVTPVEETPPTGVVTSIEPVTPVEVSSSVEQVTPITPVEETPSVKPVEPLEPVNPIPPVEPVINDVNNSPESNVTNEAIQLTDKKGKKKHRKEKPVKEKKGGNKFITFILILIIIGLAGYILYDKFLVDYLNPKDETSENEGTTEEEVTETTPVVTDDDQTMYFVSADQSAVLMLGEDVAQLKNFVLVINQNQVNQYMTGYYNIVNNQLILTITAGCSDANGNFTCSLPQGVSPVMGEDGFYSITLNYNTEQILFGDIELINNSVQNNENIQSDETVQSNETVQNEENLTSE